MADVLCCWSTKGGSGTSVVAAALALGFAERSRGCLLVDLAGDQPAVLGQPEHPGPGVLDWLHAGLESPPDALGRLELPVSPGLRLLPRGAGTAALADDNGGEVDHQGLLLLSVLAAEQRAVVVDAGALGAGAPVMATALAATAGTSLLVVRPCYLALRRVVRCGVRPTGVVVVTEPWRVLSATDVAIATGAPVVAEVPVAPAVARCVDAGLLATRRPRELRRPLRGVG